MMKVGSIRSTQKEKKSILHSMYAASTPNRIDEEGSHEEMKTLMSLTMQLQYPLLNDNFRCYTEYIGIVFEKNENFYHYIHSPWYSFFFLPNQK